VRVEGHRKLLWAWAAWIGRGNLYASNGWTDSALGIDSGRMTKVRTTEPKIVN
jgi:hypothetical protein